jgi:flagellin
VNLDAASTLISGVTTFAHTAVASTSTGTNIMTSGKYTIKITAATSATTTSFDITKVGDTSFGSAGTLQVTSKDISTANGLLDNLGGFLGIKITATDYTKLALNQTMTFEYIAKNEMKYELQDSNGVAQQISQNGAAGRTGTSAYGLAGVINSGRGVSTTIAAFATSVVGAKQSALYERANLYSVNVSNAARGGAYLTTVTNSLDKVTSALSDLGALMARLTYKEEQSATAQVNVEGAYSRIMNANMAEEQLNASKYTILQQTATAMLAQANAAPQSLLALFR